MRTATRVQQHEHGNTARQMAGSEKGTRGTVAASVEHWLFNE
jgi:hypothetical protein